MNGRTYSLPNCPRQLSNSAWLVTWRVSYWYRVAASGVMGMEDSSVEGNLPGPWQPARANSAASRRGRARLLIHRFMDGTSVFLFFACIGKGRESTTKRYPRGNPPSPEMISYRNFLGAIFQMCGIMAPALFP